MHAMRSIRPRQASAKSFCALKNKPPPPKTKCYSDSNIALSNVAKTVASEAMKAASKDKHHGFAEEIA